jgi:hypothetical protein
VFFFVVFFCTHLVDGRANTQQPQVGYKKEEGRCVLFLWLFVRHTPLSALSFIFLES